MSHSQVVGLLQFGSNAVGHIYPRSKKCSACPNLVLSPKYKMCHQCWAKLQSSGNSLCTKCNAKPPNAGRAWCEGCYRQSKQTTNGHTSANPQYGQSHQYTPIHHSHHHNAPTNNINNNNTVALRHGGGYPSAAAASPPPQNFTNTCSKCGRHSNGSNVCAGCLNHGPIVVEITTTNPKYGSILQQFMNKWPTNRSSPNIVKILSVYNAHLHARYTNYAQHVAQQMPHNDPNERRVFHGCALECGLQHTNQLCTSPTCIVCQICASGFKRKASKFCTLQFGSGFYFAYHSFKADCYAPSQANGMRAMLLCKVVMGKVQKLYQDEKHRTAPDAGYHSVIGEPGLSSTLWKGVAEAVVYSEEAILPAYVILYRP